jgi:hypothetical protein
MKKRSGIWIVVISAALLLVVSWTVQAMAGGVSLTLVRSTLNNVDDAAGRWQHEGGNIQKGSATVGQYAITRRVTTSGTTVQNTAMETITLFFSNTGTPPQNVTLQGAHHFNNGHFAGSVSAASNHFSWIKGADAAINVNNNIFTLTIQWVGANQLTLP